MGGAPVIEVVRPGVEFVSEAASAFRRAEAQVRAEFGRDVDVNSTYRDYHLQLSMWRAWEAYVASGYNPALYPGHSKALHPDDPLAFHTKGLALDSDDWVNPRIVEILADHGFIRNRLHVPNEKHHFEYLRDHDKHYGEEPDVGMTPEQEHKLDKAIAQLVKLQNDVDWLKDRTGGSTRGDNPSPTLDARLKSVQAGVDAVYNGVDWLKKRHGGTVLGSSPSPSVDAQLSAIRDGMGE